MSTTDHDPEPCRGQGLTARSKMYADPASDAMSAMRTATVSTISAGSGLLAHPSRY